MENEIMEKLDEILRRLDLITLLLIKSAPEGSEDFQNEEKL